PKRLAAWKKFQDMISELREISKILPLSQVMNQIIKKIGMEAYLRDGSEQGEIRWENIKELFTVIKKYDPLPPEEAASAFLEEVALLSNQDDVETEKDLANLMTVHCAKGLEFPVVFMVGCEEGLFPHSRAMLNAWEMEEERRLCYVGMTRAKIRLYLSWANQRNLYGSIQINPPSRFLFDIPQNLTKMQGQTESLKYYDFNDL
ncbi:MAG: 3'-5' exonuclease, partial [Candidatus Portnoybacteria bacterium]|nr:3'-5' exonuclease [Candidatus Portnoybacteria bacterium]